MSEKPKRPARPTPGDRLPYGCRLQLGVALVILGVPMLVCPGPGLASILLGLALIGVRPRRRP